MDNEKKARELANKHLQIQGVGLPIRFNRRVYKGFLNAISEALNIPVVIVSDFCECEGVQDLHAMTGECRKCGKECDY